MTDFDPLNLNYNYYPRTAIELSIIAYKPMSDIRKLVNDHTNLELCWGPAEKTAGFIPYSKLFVAKNPLTEEYFVVIQGTNPFSLRAWFKEDFDVNPGKPLSFLPGPPPNIPNSAIVSQGTFNGMMDLISLRDPATNTSFIEFLRSQRAVNIYVTGHSLGGTLTPPLMLYLNAMLNNGNTIRKMGLWSFAGLTPGGDGFNDYFNTVFPLNQNYPWRIQNSLDLAPHFWGSRKAADDIYLSYGLPSQEPWKGALKNIFESADKSRVNYKQPQPGLVLTGEFDMNSKDSYMDQGRHQHSSLTYRKLVSEHYPLG